jgi:peptidoglycan/xylan/chitin deacetylase (PgdA/CDA1 family)
VSQSTAPLGVSEAALAEQLAFLKQRNYVGLTFSECERSRTEGSLPPRAVVITFDDGYRSTSKAKPILDAAGFPATVFVVTGFVDSGEPLFWHGLDSLDANERFPLSWADLERLADDGWEIGSHTVTHPLLSNLDDRLVTRELEVSRAAIERRLGECDTLAYPYGWPDNRIASAAARAGYRAACTLTGAHVFDGPFLRPRVGLGIHDTGLRLRLKLSPQGLALRRGPSARIARKLHRRRPWLPV